MHGGDLKELLEFCYLYLLIRLFIYIYCIIFYNKPCESKILCFVVSKLDVLIDFGRLGKAAKCGNNFYRQHK